MLYHGAALRQEKRRRQNALIDRQAVAIGGDAITKQFDKLKG